MMGKKVHRRVMYRNKINTGNCYPQMGDYKIVSLENKLIEKFEIESARVLLNRELKKQKLESSKKRRLWIRCGFILGYTKKGLNSRMGKGKGGIDKYVCHIRPLDPLFELNQLSYSTAVRLMKAISYKLSIKVALVNKSREFFPSLSGLFDRQ